MKLLLTILMASIFFIKTQYSTAGAGPPELSGCLPSQVGQYRPFAETWDEGLQSALDRALDKKRSWRALIKQDKMAIGVVDLSNPATARFASVNGWTMMYAASLPKIAVLLAAYQSVEDGVLQETPDLHEWLAQMIRCSSNYAASYMIDLIGLKRIEDVLQRYHFYIPISISPKTAAEFGWAPVMRKVANEIPNPLRACLMPRRLLKYAASTTCLQTVNSSARNARGRCWRYFQGRPFTTNL
ncbi:exported hypothetical protein [Syntrophobacter sp. SbD1]|nr:exported hypothetical protein [Syntrophobacter sp. SbD1]